MRVLKFRAWDIVAKRFLHPWPDGFYILGETLFFDLIRQQLKERNPEKTTVEMLNDVIIQQFTGLLDKNGKEIYEGDIVRVIDMPCSPDEHEWKGEVVFKHSCWEVVGREELLLYVFEYTNDNGYKPLLYEVIGNIYENPELLNVSSEKE